MRRPALRFAAIGAALWTLSAAWPRSPAPSAPAGGDADARFAAAALAVGLADDDAVVQRQLLRNARFLGEHDAGALDLAESDLVVQRRLASRLRLAIERAARAAEPDDAALRAYAASHRDRFAGPARVTLTQVFLDRARDAGDAGRLRAALRSGTAARGDALPIAAALNAISAVELEALLGTAVARAAFAAPLGEWSAPVASPYGHHLLRVDARTPPHLPPFETIRPAVREALLAERAAAALAAAERELRGE